MPVVNPSNSVARNEERAPRTRCTGEPVTVTAVPPDLSPLLGLGQAALAGCMRKKAAQLPSCASILRRKSCLAASIVKET